ncbi:MAG TPA: hypothetical protein VGL22_04420 [Terracidiphilus sp.]|jgi:hypothetical protein
MQQAIFWPTLVVLAGASATIPVVQNPTTRHLLYWVVLSPLALGVVSAFWLAGIR